MTLTAHSKYLLTCLGDQTHITSQKKMEGNQIMFIDYILGNWNIDMRKREVTYTPFENGIGSLLDMFPLSIWVTFQ